MPLYQYFCDECGFFEAWQSMGEASMPCPCPICRTPSRRALAAPSLNLMNGSLRNALGRAEKSSGEPAIVPRSHLANLGPRLGGHHSHDLSQRWMIGHGH